MPYVIFFLIYATCRWYFKLLSSSTPRNLQQSLTGMSLRAIITGGIEGKGFCGEEKTTNFVLDVLISNMLLLHHRTSCARSKFSFQVKDVMLLSELKIVVSSAYNIQLDEERHFGKSLI